MINPRHRTQTNIVKFAFIEACLEYYGHYKSRFISDVFGSHPKDAARVIRYYQEFNPEAVTVSQGVGTLQSDKFKRKALKRSADAEHFLTILYTMYGSDPPCGAE